MKYLLLLLLPFSALGQITDANLNLEADTIRTETHAGRNTAQRVGRMFKNIIANKWNGSFNLTTTGTSGAASFSGGVLNIPQYAGGSSLPSNAVGYLRNNGSGTLTWANVGSLLTGSLPTGSMPYINGTDANGLGTYAFVSVGSDGQILKINSSVPQWVSTSGSWTNITLINGWSAGSRTPQYRILITGEVVLRGDLNGSSSTNPIFTSSLPSTSIANCYGYAVKRVSSSVQYNFETIINGSSASITDQTTIQAGSYIVVLDAIRYAN